MADVTIATCRGDLILEFAGKTFVELDNLGAFSADQMVVMVIFSTTNHLKAGDAIPKIKPLHEPHVLEHVHGPVDRRKITPFPQRLVDFFVGHGMGVCSEEIKNAFSGTGYFTGPLAQLIRQGGEFLFGM